MNPLLVLQQVTSQGAYYILSLLSLGSHRGRLSRCQTGVVSYSIFEDMGSTARILGISLYIASTRVTVPTVALDRRIPLHEASESSEHRLVCLSWTYSLQSLLFRRAVRLCPTGWSCPSSWYHCFRIIQTHSRHTFRHYGLSAAAVSAHNLCKLEPVLHA